MDFKSQAGTLCNVSLSYASGVVWCFMSGVTCICTCTLRLYVCTYVYYYWWFGDFGGNWFKKLTRGGRETTTM